MTRRAIFHRCGLLLMAVMLSGALASADEPDKKPSDARWEELRPMLFPDKTILDGTDIVTLHAPERAIEASLVPVTVSAKFPQSANRYIKSIALVVDENPAPMAATFRFTPDSGVADVETRVRVNDYGYIHAVAETNDGKFYAVRTYVKASGGCSAPMSKDAEAAMTRLGQMKFQQLGAFQPGAPNRGQLMISHPNHNGMQMDQLTRLYIPPHYIQTIVVTVDGKTVLSVDADISLSEDPHIRFYYVPRAHSAMAVTVKDSQDKTFTESWKIGPQRGS
jgi:sulfur-oxidizing protein SoxY